VAPESPLPCSQQPAASLYTKPDQSSLPLATVFLEDHCNTFPSTLRYSQLSLTFRFPHQNSVCLSLLPSACHPTRTSPPTQHAISTANHNTSHDAKFSCLPSLPVFTTKYLRQILVRVVHFLQYAYAQRLETWQHGRAITNCSTALSSSQPLGERFTQSGEWRVASVQWTFCFCKC